ncbi:phage tail protein [Undibacterium sp. Ji42W]|uniref:phage tail protein n=1 Tax=Undibacterium sp. Ji42W TaxID=3413039 RepID=UPI003BF371BF
MSTLANAVPAQSADTVAINPLPVGSIISFGGSDAPNGWLLCVGQTISQSTYPNLFAVIGGTVPDLRSRFVIGTGQGNGLSNYPLKSTGGVETVTLNVNQIPSHQHYGFGESTSTWPMGTQSSNQMGSKGGIDYDNYYYGTTSTGGSQAHENRPPYFALAYIIKY